MMSVAAIRDALPANPRRIDHAGVYFARWAAASGDEWVAVRAVRDRLIETAPPPAYRMAFQRWQGLALGRPSVRFVVTALSPLVIGLGNENPSENGLSLHHVYGMPYLPGSALKGLTCRALTRAAQPPEAVAALLGASESTSLGASEGAVTFYDAWLDPAGALPFYGDTVTVHHPEYYRKHGEVPPSDFDDPTPIPLLVVRPGARFEIVLTIDPAAGEQAQRGLDLTADALQWALEHEGIGGKTNAGYGRLRSGRALVTSVEPAVEETPPVAKLPTVWDAIALVRSGTHANPAPFEEAYQVAQALSDSEQRQVAQEIFKKINGNPGSFSKHKETTWHRFAIEKGRPPQRR